MKDHIIVGVHVTNRAQRASEMQQILSRHGRLIRTRLGLHDVEGDQASPNGLIVLDMVGEEPEIEAMCNELRTLHGIQVQRMFFSHPE
jgi:hypothetical protein